MEFNLSTESSLMLLCCCVDHNPVVTQYIELMLPESLDWEYVLYISRYHGIAPLVYKNICSCKNNSLIPSHILDNFKKEYFLSSFKNLLFMREYHNIVKQFNTEDIKLIPLKGIDFLNSLYSDIALRTLSDIDILILRKDIAAAQKILLKMGYEIYPDVFYLKGKHFHSTFTKCLNQFSLPVEVHWHIDFPNTPFNITIEDFWPRAKSITDGTLSYYSLCPEDNLLLNGFHILRDPYFQGGKIYLKNLLDIYELINRNSEIINFDIIMERAKIYNIRRPMLLVLFLVQELLNKTMPFNIGNLIEKEGFTDAMINTLLKERIFLKKAESFSLPGGVYIKTGSDKKSLIIINPLTMVSELYMSIRVKYDAYKSFRKSFIPIAKMVYRSLCNLLKVLFLCFFDYQKSRETLENNVQTKDNLLKIDNWLRGNSL